MATPFARNRLLRELGREFDHVIFSEHVLHFDFMCRYLFSSGEWWGDGNKLKQKRNIGESNSSLCIFVPHKFLPKGWGVGVGVGYSVNNRHFFLRCLDFLGVLR